MRRSDDNPLGIPVNLRGHVEEILKLTDAFCAGHLDAEYRDLVRRLVAKLARKRPSPLARGNLRVWAGAAIYAVGTVNFLFDSSQRPHLTGDQLSELTGIPKSTLASKARLIRDLFRIDYWHPEFSRRALLESHPLRRSMAPDGGLGISEGPARSREAPADGRRKLSEIVKEMAFRALSRPDDLPSIAGVEASVILAAAAWNAALGDSSLRDGHAELLRQRGWAGNPWGELASADTDRLIAELIDFKQKHHADDRRRIETFEVDSEFGVRVYWVDEEEHRDRPHPG